MLPDPQRRNLGIVSFSTKGPVLFSTNNLQGQTASPQGCLGRTVPGIGCAHLVGIGICGGMQETVEAVVGCPPYPARARLLSGAVQSFGALNIASAPSNLTVNALDARQPGPERARPWQPGQQQQHSASHQPGAIADHGTVEAVGGSRHRHGIDGSVLPHHDPLYLPSIDVNVELLRRASFQTSATSARQVTICSSPA